jgi:hypothetical protein
MPAQKPDAVMYAIATSAVMIRDAWSSTIKSSGILQQQEQQELYMDNAKQKHDVQ